MASSPHTQRQGAHERALGRVGDQQARYARMYDPVRQYVRDTATRDDSNLLRSRANADNAQLVTSNIGTIDAMRAGNAAGVTEQTGLAEDINNAGLRAANLNALKSRDANIASAGGMDLGQAAKSGRATAEVARIEAAEAQQKATIAAEKQYSKTAAAAAVGSAVARGIDGARDEELMKEWTNADTYKDLRKQYGTFENYRRAKRTTSDKVWSGIAAF